MTIKKERAVVAWVVGGWVVLAAMGVILFATLGGCWNRGEPWGPELDFGHPADASQKARPTLDEYQAPKDLGVLDAALEAVMDLLEAAPDEGAWDLEQPFTPDLAEEKRHHKCERDDND